MYSEKSSMRASHRPAAFCAFRPLLLVPFVALVPSIGNSPQFVKGNQKNKLTIPVIPYRIVVIVHFYEGVLYGIYQSCRDFRRTKKRK